MILPPGLKRMPTSPEIFVLVKEGRYLIKIISNNARKMPERGRCLIGKTLCSDQTDSITVLCDLSKLCNPSWKISHLRWTLKLLYEFNYNILL